MSTSTKRLPLVEILYTEHSIPAILKKYEESLKSSRNTIELAHAAKLAEYRNMITDRKFLSKVRKNFNEIYHLIDINFPNIRFCIDGRRKSLISTEYKIEKLLSENRSLDLLRDVFAFRILLFGKTSNDLISSCYKIAQEVIEYNFSNGLILCEADVPQQTANFDATMHPGIIIPNETGIPKEFRYGVKDYICNPKTNGYQSLHITFRTTTGACFEVQIRTFDMHLHAESGQANHKEYKAKKYHSRKEIALDRSRVQIPGYGISPQGDLFDFVGLEKGLEILKRQKTY